MHNVIRDQQNREKIDEILARVNLQTLRSKIQDQTPYQAYVDYFENYNKKNQYMKLTKQERLQIYENDWQKLILKQKKFYSELSKVNRLSEEFKSSQNFYKERIKQIKYDSSSTFNETSVRLAINEYIKDHPEPH